MRRVPDPLLLFCRQGAALLFLPSCRPQLDLIGRIRGYDAPDSPLHDLVHGGLVKAHSALCVALRGEIKQHPLYIVGADLADLKALQLVFPERDGAAVVFHLPVCDMLGFFDVQPVFRPLREAVTLGQDVQTAPQLRPDRRFLFLQLCGRFAVDALVLFPAVLATAQVDLCAVSTICAFLCSCHMLHPLLTSSGRMI